MSKKTQQLKTILSARGNRGLQRVIASALNRVVKNDSNVVASYKEYIDCGSWTTQC